MNQPVSRFWKNFINISKSYGVKSSALRWYVRHAEEYIKAHKTRRLSVHTPEMLEAYLKSSK